MLFQAIPGHDFGASAAIVKILLCDPLFLAIMFHPLGQTEGAIAGVKAAAISIFSYIHTLVIL